MTLYTIDFETFAIQNRPVYPPEPVGVSIKRGTEPSEYLAWGHPEGNNCTKFDAYARLMAIWADPTAQVLCHNAKFDLAVAEERIGLPALPWDRVHDTMFLLFLADPHAKSLALKPSAERYLDMAPEEQTEVHDWLWEHRRALPTTPVRPARSNLGAFIAYAPGDMVGRYARGDTDRTHALFVKLMTLIDKHGMSAAYDRERRLLPILMENERIGIRVDLERLERECTAYGTELERADDWLRARLNAPGLSLDNDADYADALASAGMVADSAWKLTATGRRSVAKGALTAESYNDREVYNVYGYRNRLATCLRMFMTKWRDQALVSGGYIHPQWNQTRGERGGTRSGRPSMTNPNLLNVAKEFKTGAEAAGWVMPTEIDLATLPLVREYMQPDPGGVWLHRDYDGQELRVYSHFERGSFYRMFRENPRAKPHDYVREKIKEITGNDIGKTLTKNVNFGRIYGAGAPRIAELMGGDMAAAKRLLSIHQQAMPDLKTVQQELERLARARKPLRTWGGRIYFAEPAREVEGQYREFFYKLLNYLVQGSSADITKEAIIRWHGHPDRDASARLLLTIYDETNITSDASIAERQMQVLDEAMSSIELGVALPSNGKSGPAWGLCKETK